MAFKEIERKFLVAGDFRGEVSGASHIVQGYLSTTPGRSVRVRLRDEQGWITVKGPMRGLTRIEWEKEIPAGEAQLLLSLCEPGVIDKTRHLVPAPDGHVWEVDEFHGDNAGLLVAEVRRRSVLPPGLAGGGGDRRPPLLQFLADKTPI